MQVQAPDRVPQAHLRQWRDAWQAYTERMLTNTRLDRVEPLTVEDLGNIDEWTIDDEAAITADWVAWPEREVIKAALAVAAELACPLNATGNVTADDIAFNFATSRMLDTFREIVSPHAARGMVTHLRNGRYFRDGVPVLSDLDLSAGASLSLLHAVAAFRLSERATAREIHNLSISLADAAVRAVNHGARPITPDYIHSALLLCGKPTPTTRAATDLIDTHRSLARWYATYDSVNEETWTSIRDVIMTTSLLNSGGDADVLPLMLLSGFETLLAARKPGETLDTTTAVLAARDVLTNRTDDPKIHADIDEITADIIQVIESLTITFALDETVDRAERQNTWANHLIKDATPYLADADMCAVLASSALTKPDQPLDPSDLPSPHGILWLAHKIAADTVTGTPVEHTAIAWTTTTEPTSDGLHTTGIRIVSISDDRNKSPNWPNRPNLDIVFNEHQWQFGETFHDFATKERHPLDPYTDVARVLPALWEISRQPITVTTKTDTPDKRTRKAATRAGTYRPDGINLISLRRSLPPAPPTGTLPAPDGTPSNTTDTSKRDYRNRWIVRCHWRRQWYPSINAHQNILILPYTKGPEDKPLKDAVNVWVIPGRDMRDDMTADTDD